MGAQSIGAAVEEKISICGFWMVLKVQDHVAGEAVTHPEAVIIIPAIGPGLLIGRGPVLWMPASRKPPQYAHLIETLYRVQLAKYNKKRTSCQKLSARPMPLFVEPTERFDEYGLGA